MQAAHDLVVGASVKLQLLSHALRCCYRNKRQYPEARTVDGVAILRVDVPIYFANAQSIKTRLKKFEELLQVGRLVTYLQVAFGRQGVALCPAWPLLDRDGIRK